MAVLPPLAVIAFSENNLKQTRHAEIHEEALRSVKFAGSEVQRIFDGIENLLLAFIQGPFVDGRDEAGCNAYTQRLLPRVPHLRALGIADTGGMAWCGTGAGLSIADRSYFKDALAKPDKLFLGNYSVGRASRAQVIAFGLKRPDTEAVAYGSLDLAWLSNKLLERGLPEGGSITLADRAGIVIARQPFPEKFVGTQIPEPFMRLVHGDRPGTEEVTSQDGTARVLGYIPVASPPLDLYISVGLSYDASYGNSERQTRIAAAIAAAGAFLALVAAWLVGDRMVVRPLSIIAQTASKWRAGEGQARTNLRDASEFGLVATNLDRLMDELLKRNEERELLTRELEHRVKNMLANVQAIAGMSFKQQASESELKTFLERLRALGQGYSALRADRWEEASLSDVIARSLEPLGARTNARISVEGPTVKLNPRQVLAISMVLHELGTNAVKYGAFSNNVGMVSLRWALEAEKVHLIWEESLGPPVTAPSRNGFGSRLIHAYGNELGSVDIDYNVAGLRCSLRFAASGF